MTDKGRHKVFPCICNICLAKWTLILLNLVLFVAGFSVICSAIWVGWNRHSFVKFTGLIKDEEIRSKIVDQTESIVVTRAIYVIIGVVAFLLFVCLLGCCGAVCGSRCSLTHYAMILLVILVLEIIAGYLATGYAYNAEKEIKAAMNATLRHYNDSVGKENKSDATLIWDSIFLTFNCCGVYDHQDLAYKDDNGTNIIPETCCAQRFINAKGELDCYMHKEDKVKPTEVSCYDAIFEVIERKSNIVIGIIFGLVLGQCLSIILA
ncbi:hypothetical protein B7P43_G05111, partial [Cryptotermes secundus]